MLRSLNSGVTGLLNHQVRMDVIGNNISNVNTVGYKGRRTTFEESFNQMMKGATKSASKAGGTNPMQVGLGVNVGSIDIVTGQGGLQNTGRIFDLAIEGSAFFGVSDGNGTYYTRNGAFQLDADGYIMLPTNGMVLQGKMADAYGVFPPGTAIGNLQIPLNQQSPSKETTWLSLGRNLNADGDAKGSVDYSMPMYHPADVSRAALTNSENDPGRATTPLSALYDANGKSLGIKQDDTIIISWQDQASEGGLGVIFHTMRFNVNKQDALEGKENSIWDIEQLAAAIEKAINEGNPDAATDPHTVVINPDGTFQINYNDTGNPLTPQIFKLNITSSNPLSESQVQNSFAFGSHIGPAIGNYPDALTATSAVLLRPAEQFDYIDMLRDHNGTKLYPGIEAGDTIDIDGSVGKTSIASGKSDPLEFYPANVYDDVTGQGAYLGDADSIAFMTEYTEFVRNVTVWYNQQMPTPAYDLDAPQARTDYLATAQGGTLYPLGEPAQGGGTTVTYNWVNGRFEIADGDYQAYLAANPTAPKRTLLDDLLAKIGNDFNLPPNYIDRDGSSLPSVSMDTIDTDDVVPAGAIVIRGIKGKDFQLKNISIQAKNLDSDQTRPTSFDAVMKFKPKTKAADVEVADCTLAVYDESGEEHTLTMTFVHTGRANEWEWKASFAGKEDILPGSGTGKVTFGQDGTIASWLYDNGGSQLVVDPHNGSNMMRIDLNVGGPGDKKGLVQYTSASTVNFTAQDGYPSGNLIEVSIDEFGLIEGAFSNGTTQAIAQIMMVDFANPGGLLDLSDSVFTNSANSGDPIWGMPGKQSSSKLRPAALEMSNVDLAGEFTNMITTQKGYQANSRIITVSDTLLEELVNLKR